jgi:DNA-binding NarL/FixJ family response regulator
MISILIADDHALMREGIKQLISMFGNIEVVCEAENGGQVMECLQNQSVDLAMLDMSMPGVSGVDLIAWIREHYPHLPVLILSMHNEPQVALRALKAGANGYITKDNDPETLVSAIQKVAGGGQYIDAMLAEQVVFKGKPSSRTSHLQLSEREIYILRLLARGFSINRIAEELVISNKTVSTHKARLMQKMAFSSNAELVRYAVAQGLID